MGLHFDWGSIKAKENIGKHIAITENKKILQGKDSG